MRLDLSRLVRRLRGEESGFTLIEIAVATAVIMTALILMAGVITSGLTGTAVARERQTANGLANQTIEKIRALPYTTLRAGLATSDLLPAADPNITTSGCGAGTHCFQGERIVHGTNPTVDPLVPHVRSITASDETSKPFTLKSYVTYYQNNTTANAFRVTIHVGWESRVRSESDQSVEVQTIIFPNGCASLPEHTYSGPCLSAFTASGTADASTITTTGALGEIDIDRAILYGGATSSDATIEQTSRIDGASHGPGAVLEAVGGDEQEIGRTSVTSQANNDPGAGKPIYDTHDLTPQAVASTSLTAPTATLNAAVSGGDSGRTTSTTSASTSASRPCPNLTSFTDETDSAPCGASSSTAGSTTSLNASLNAGLLSASSFPLASIGGQSTPTTSIVDRATATGIDTSRATVSRSAVNFSLGGLPNIALIKPAAFDYFVKLSGYTDTATAQAGTGSTAPAHTSSGQFSFYTGAVLNPYTTVELSAITAEAIPTIPTLEIDVPVLDTEITLSATVTPESKTSTSSCNGTCTRTSGSAKVTPITISVTTTIVVGGETVLDTTTALDPGTIQAKASYVAAPTS